MAEQTKARVRLRRRDVVAVGKGNKVKVLDKPVRYCHYMKYEYQDQTPTYYVSPGQFPLELECSKRGKGVGVPLEYIDENGTELAHYPTVLQHRMDGNVVPFRVPAVKLIVDARNKDKVKLTVVLPYGKRKPARGGQVIAWAFCIGSFAFMALTVYVLAKDAFAAVSL